jgi:[ribosomal protein S18]-alanine N-acetyltransferase
VQVRRAISADISAMIELERETPTAAHWTCEQYEARIGGHTSSNTESLALVAEDQPAEGAHTPPLVVGFLVAHRVDTEWELENIAVGENVRQRGIGSLLMNAFLKHVRSGNGLGIFLEVRESNKSARALYRNLGFQEEGRRKGYYPDPPEDAVICRITL